LNALYDIIGVPFGYLMRLIYSLCNNYAVAIILFTVITKILLFPVNYKTQKGSARMQLLQPKLEKLKKSFANNPQRLQEEQQKLYQQEGVNPMGSCLPMFIQMFLLFGVIDVIYKPITHILDISKNVIKEAVTIAHTATGDKSLDMSNLRCELLTMQNLRGNGDQYASLSENFLSKVSEFIDKFTIFGANLGTTPTLSPEGGWTKEALILASIPFLAGLSQLLVSVYSQIHQKKVNPVSQPGGGCLTFMTYFFPILSIWFAFQVPAGVGFYWIWSSIFSFIITFALNCYFTPERIKVINEQEKEKARIYAEKHPNKKSFMQRMMEQQAALEQQNGSSSSGKANGVSRSEQNKQNRDKIKEARKRMAEKYGDSYEDNDDED